MKSQSEILAKLGIAALNPMQLEARKAIIHEDEVILLSPTGTGKTLAFLLPILNQLSSKEEMIQALVLVPSRELAIQIEQVLREMGSGYRVFSVYGGRPGSKERQDMKNPPAILIGTPGRVADHLRREAFDPRRIKFLVLDEFDKSLETGFEKEMRQIVNDLPNVRKKVLTSATNEVDIPDFMRFRAPMTIDYLGTRGNQLKLVSAVSDQKDKLDALEKVLGETGNGRGIVFCNVKGTLAFVADFFDSRGIDYGIFMGGLEQTERERALIKFRNGTHRILLATDLAARGIDVPELDFIIHYQIPLREAEFTHRNGRTARMHANGTAYVLRYAEHDLPDFIVGAEEMDLPLLPHPVENSKWTTLYVSGGRKDKISKGDLAGLFFKQGGLEKKELGVIELLADCAFVGVPAKKAEALVALLNNTKLKKRKVRISEL
ncbi:DEAD/DEAH box helicase [Neolewinella antarctica]|uniref:Superfamily II DNA/RNA helicase n=1 Tax=Neolewinella antarctica TaxID=442734 RepID=A0ABX0X893_9BACT|nr:DEAD/DEAH box helicase [Neolewinella antarctica]NJC25421.1 superfamily II DNA/RNA helicase [Neolewinella antarctica]